MLLVGSCSRDRVRVIRLTDNHEFPGYRLESLRGVRDGDHMRAIAILTDGSEKLTMSMVFVVGVPARLAVGNFLWEGKDDASAGAVSGKSVNFLGGQSDGPSLGGVFELHPPRRPPQFRVTFPVTKVQPWLEPQKGPDAPAR